MNKRALGLVALLPLLAACHWTPNMNGAGAATPSGAKHTASATATHTPSASPTPSVTVKPVVRKPGDLDAGSLTHKLNAGAANAVITYYVKVDPLKIKASDQTPVQVSLHMENADTTHTIKITDFKVVEEDSTGALTTVMDDQGEFVVTPPYNYNGAFTLARLDPTIPSATLMVQVDILVETTPTSGTYFRQTVLDNIHLTFATETTTHG